MIDRLTYIESGGHDPYRNLAIEEYLMSRCGERECILYLWQNQRTVVVGRNQDPWKECRVDMLEEEGGHLARRNSGGGAVYHDLGNLNFTFLARKENYDVKRQLGVVRLALEALGAEAELSGRNDLLIDGWKFSGNAFYENGDFCCHHGTVMLDVDMGALSRYLTPSEKKLDSKGVDSVRARVKNLKELLPELTAVELKESFRWAFERGYKGKSQAVPLEALDAWELKKREQRFSSGEWKYGRNFEFQRELSHRFSWGELSLRLQIRRGRITDAAVYSDALRLALLGKLPMSLKGARYERGALRAALEGCPAADGQEAQMKADMMGWLDAAELSSI